MGEKLKYYLTGVKRKGVFNQLREVLYDYYYGRKFKGYHFSEDTVMLYDRPITAPEAIAEKSKGKDSYRNVPISSYYLFKGFSLVPIRNSSVNFLDIGCGNGKLLVAGMILGFNKVIGIDIDEQAVKHASVNCEKAQKKYLSSSEVLVCDAGEYIIPDSVNVIALFNPFGEATLNKVVTNIYNSYTRSKREIYIIYYNPLHNNCFAGNQDFKVFQQYCYKSGNTIFIIYRLG